MIDIEECKKRVLDEVEGRFALGQIKPTNWGFVVGWQENILGYGPALVDGETGYVFITGSQRKKPDELNEFGLIMMRMQGCSKKEKEDAWLEHYKRFEIVPFF